GFSAITDNARFMTSITETRADDPGLLTRIREKFTRSFEYVGELTDLAIQTMQQMRRGPIERPLLMAQFDQIGVRSISIVVITSAFIGMVLALQTAYALEDFGGK